MPTITPFQLNEYNDRLSNIYIELEQEVFMRMAEILKTNDSDDKDYAFLWQAQKLQELRLLNQENITTLSQVSGIAREEILNIFRRVGFDSIETIDQQVSKFGLDQLSMPSNIDNILKAFVDNTFDNLDNFVNLRLIDTQAGLGAASEIYKRIIETTVASVLVGNKTINEVVTETIIKFRQQGLPSGFIDRGGRRWSIQSYVDAAVRTTTNQVYNQVRASRMEEYGLHLVVVDYYRGARPACSPIQGKVCSLRQNGEDLEGYPSIYDFGYGRPDGIRGVHCRHSLIPFDKNLSTNNFNPPDESDANEYYKRQQKQRALEREVRKAKENLAIAESVGFQTEIDRWKENVRNRQTAVRQYAQSNDLPRRYDKERIIK